LLATTVAEIVIAAEEIKPRHLRRYGALDEETARPLVCSPRAYSS
jgi:hypothetical protein